MSDTGYLSPPHIHDGSSVSGIMARVCLALLPGLMFYAWYFGTGVLMQCMLAVVFAVAVEWFVLYLAGKKYSFPGDYSVIVTALLFALTITPFTPWWINLSGIAFAVIVAKHVYGGLGCNLFNPAMAGFVFILLCFPAQMNSWPGAAGAVDVLPDAGNYIDVIFSGEPVDGLSGASPLNHMKSGLDSMAMVSEIISAPVYGSIGGRGWEIINLAFLAGGIWLLLCRVITWHIPAGFLFALFACSLSGNVIDSIPGTPPLFNLFTGGTMLCAFFIATDPVTSPATRLGRLVYGMLIGIFTFVIRTWGGFPDGLAFAVLLGNAFAPLIGQYTTPGILGEERRP